MVSHIATSKIIMKLNQHLSKIVSTKTKHFNPQEGAFYCRTVGVNLWLNKY